MPTHAQLKATQDRILSKHYGSAHKARCAVSAINRLIPIAVRNVSKMDLSTIKLDPKIKPPVNGPPVDAFTIAFHREMNELKKSLNLHRR